MRKNKRIRHLESPELVESGVKSPHISNHNGTSFGFFKKTCGKTEKKRLALPPADTAAATIKTKKYQLLVKIRIRHAKKISMRLEVIHFLKTRKNRIRLSRTIKRCQ